MAASWLLGAKEAHHERNVGNLDRLFRGLGGAEMLTCAVMAPLPLLFRVGIFGAMGGYLLLTEFAGSCRGSKLMGRA